MIGRDIVFARRNERPDHGVPRPAGAADAEASAHSVAPARLRTEVLVAASFEIVWWADARRRIGGARGWTEFTGQIIEAATGTGWLDRVHPDDRDRVAAVRPQVIEDGASVTTEYRLFHAASQDWRWVVERVARVSDLEGNLLEWVGSITDVHARKAAEMALRASEEHMRLAIEASGVGTWDVDLVEGTRSWSDQLKLMLGIDRDTPASEETLFEGVHPADRERVRDANIAWATNGKVTSEVIFRIVRKDTKAIRWIVSSGRACFSPSGQPVRRLGTWQDITDRRLAEDKVWAAANLDPLTALANRSLFQCKLKQAVRDAAGLRWGIGLLLIDLDHFKEINDTLGHDAGDTVLRMMSDRITACVPPGGDVARLGGDEFAILLPDLSLVDMAVLSQTVIQAVARPVQYETLTLNCSVSIGSSRFPTDDPTGAELLKNADLALYAAKEAGRNRYAAFEPAFRTAIEHRVAVLRSVRHALDCDAIVPFYQPKVSLSTEAMIGFEALLRWRSPEGLKSPGAIRDAFQDPELAVQIGNRMLSKVIADIRSWRRQGIPFGRIALNVSDAEFANVDVAARTLSSLERAGLPTDVLEIEILESVLFHGESGRTLDVMHQLRERGVTLSLDDFGTGYASLSHLQRFPIRWLKIDRSFIRDLPDGGAAAAIVRSVVGLAHDLGLSVVAEGVEKVPQLQALCNVGCDAVQGYLVAKPMAASRVPHFLDAWSGFAALRRRSGRRRVASA